MHLTFKAFGISKEPEMSLVTSALEKSHKLPTHNQQYFNYLVLVLE
jgi:hypothetical protein